MSVQTIESIDGSNNLSNVKDTNETTVSNITGFLPKESLKRPTLKTGAQLVTVKKDGDRKPIDLSCTARFVIPFEDTIENDSKDGKSEIWTNMDIVNLLHKN